ncbi:MAG: hypothetical protein Q7U73_08975 [Rubrivivax sp.]|nr:hypothetical protein [Rubrivivax sp.]
MTPRGVRWVPRVALVALLTLQACIVVPQTREVYDPACRMLTRELTLGTAVLGGFQSCAGDACVAMLAAAGAVTAASMVISGSIVLVGNVVYWFERQGQCHRAAAPLPPEPLASAAHR